MAAEFGIRKLELELSGMSWCVCVHVCVRVCVHVHVFESMWTHKYVCCTHTHVYVGYTCMYVCEAMMVM